MQNAFVFDATVGDKMLAQFQLEIGDCEDVSYETPFLFACYFYITKNVALCFAFAIMENDEIS